MTCSDEAVVFFEVEEVSVGYGQVRILSGVNVRVDSGEIVVLLGANGMGKSTLLRSVAGFLPVQDGRITLNGERISGLRAEEMVARGLALVPQGRALFPTMTVDDNLELGGYCLRGKRRREAVQEARTTIFSLFPVLEKRRRQRAGTLSGGEQQMLAIGRALMGGPKLMLLDEPSTGLAPRLVLELMEVLGRLKEETGISVLLAEQDVAAALRIAGRGYIVGEGRILLEGPCEELKDADMFREIYLGKSAGDR